MKDRWAYLNLLPERRVGSNKPLHLWGGAWASIDCEKRRDGVKEAEGEGRVRKTRMQGKIRGDQPILMNFILSILKWNVLINVRWRGRTLENLQSSTCRLAQPIKSIVQPPPPSLLPLRPAWSRICFTNFQFTPQPLLPIQPRQLGGVGGGGFEGGKVEGDGGNLGAGGETLTLMGEMKKLTLQPQEGRHMREGGRKTKWVTSEKEGRKEQLLTHTEVLSYHRHEVLSYHRHRLNCRHSFLSDTHDAPRSPSTSFTFFHLTAFPYLPSSPLHLLPLLFPYSISHSRRHLNRTHILHAT